MEINDKNTMKSSKKSVQIDRKSELEGISTLTKQYTGVDGQNMSDKLIETLKIEKESSTNDSSNNRTRTDSYNVLSYEENKEEVSQNDEDLGNYITQVVTDIGKSINKELLMDKIAQQMPKISSQKIEKKMRCKMASATNSWGISAEEYSKFAIHVYQYLSYIKGLELPTLEQLKDEDKIVEISKEADDKKLLVFDLDETLVH